MTKDNLVNNYKFRTSNGTKVKNMLFCSHSLRLIELQIHLIEDYEYIFLNKLIVLPLSKLPNNYHKAKRESKLIYIQYH